MVPTTDVIHQFNRLSSNRNKEHILLNNLNNAVALDFDWQERCIYWSEITEISAFIKRICDLSDSGATISERSDHSNIQTLHSNTLQSPDGIAVDCIGRNLYWCDKGKETIEVSTLDGKYRRVLIRRNLEEPRAIVLNPLEGILFWTDWGEKPYIGRASMDGTDDRIILDESLGWPNALTIDYIRRELYFADAHGDYNGVVDFEGPR